MLSGLASGIFTFRYFLTAKDDSKHVVVNTFQIKYEKIKGKPYS